jgi:hypothetical protein
VCFSLKRARNSFYGCECTGCDGSISWLVAKEQKNGKTKPAVAVGGKRISASGSCEHQAINV